MARVVMPWEAVDSRQRVEPEYLFGGLMDMVLKKSLFVWWHRLEEECGYIIIACRKCEHLRSQG